MKRTFLVSYLDFIIKVETQKISQQFFYKLEILYESFQEAQIAKNADEMLHFASEISKLILEDKDLNLDLSFINKDELKINKLGNDFLNKKNKNIKEKDYNKLLKDCSKEWLAMILIYLKEEHIVSSISFRRSPEALKSLKEDYIFMTNLANSIYFILRIEKREVLEKSKPS